MQVGCITIFLKFPLVIHAQRWRHPYEESDVPVLYFRLTKTV